jgi:hypothetical protein
MKGRSAPVAAVLATLLLALPAWAGAAIIHRHTAAGQALARQALLARSDLGRGWAPESAAAAKAQFLTCSAFNPPTPAVTEIGAIGSPTYQRSASGPFLEQTAWVYSTPGQEAALWARVIRPGLVRCLAASVKENSGAGARATVRHAGSLRLAPVGVARAAYRVSGTLAVSGQSIDIYVDMLVLGSGRTMTSLVLSSFEQPVSPALELRLARAAAGRLELG